MSMPCSSNAVLGIAALLVACTLVAAPLHAELALPETSSWGSDSSVAADEVVQYLICDDRAQCQPIGEGAPDLAASPIQLENVEPGLKTLRARYCVAASDGSASADCGPLSEPGAPFRYDGRLTATSFAAYAEDSGSSDLHLRADERYSTTIPLGVSLPISAPVLDVDIEREADTVLVLSLRGVRNPERVYLWSYVSPYQTLEASRSLPELETALQEGESALTLTVEVMRGGVRIGRGEGAHITGRTLFGTLVTLFDSDHDGVPLWPKQGVPSCTTSQWSGCSDNCKTSYNPDQSACPPTP